MRFIEHGPDVPERLVQLHSDGNVVFFCGAGISYPAGLPSFEGLVNQTFDGLHVTMEPAEALAHKQGRYDSVFELLERRLGNRPSVREHVLRILTPPAATLAKPEAIATHQALLTLSKTNEGTRRLVTTNFDRLFSKLTLRTFAAKLRTFLFRRRAGGMASSISMGSCPSDSIQLLSTG